MMLRQDFAKRRGFVNYSTRLCGLAPLCSKARRQSGFSYNEIELIGHVDSQHLHILCYYVFPLALSTYKIFTVPFFPI